MIIVDASAMVEALVGRDVDARLLDVLTGEVHAPHLLDVEVLSVVRGLVLGRKLSPARAEEARIEHFSFGIVRHGIEPIAGRVWELRRQFTAYDAVYLALAEALDAPLHTCDAKLASGHSAKVTVYPATR
ncbi:MAG: type II toxin-antitoxin system VapC family toxin [Dermatophilaceae bacterium]